MTPFESATPLDSPLRLPASSWDGRVVKASDLNLYSLSLGVLPRRFKSCSQRSVLLRSSFDR